MSGNQMLLLGGAQAPAVDPYFYSVTSLLHGDGTNGGQNNTFLDSSSNNFTITRNGNTTQGSFSPFSQTGWSNYFSGSDNSYLFALNNTALSLPSGTAFTIEAWIYPTRPNNGAQSGFRNIVSKRVSNSLTTNYAVMLWFNSEKLGFYNGSTGYFSNANIPQNAWTHFAYVYDGGTSLKLYINGILDNTFSATPGATNSAAVWIGSQIDDTGTYDNFGGYISNLRIVKGSQVYTSNFTPSVTPLTAITNTSLLTCQSNRFIDNSANAFSIISVGTPSIQPFSPFNPTSAYSTSSVGGSGYFDGSGDWLNTSSTQVIPSGSFTVEAWVYLTTTVTGAGVVAQGTLGDAARFSLAIEAGLWWVQIGAATINAGTPIINTWTHLAATFNGSTLTLYVNGTSVGTVSTSTNAQNTTLRIGSLGPSDWIAYYWPGYIGQIRISNTVRSISVPTALYTADANTVFLSNFTNGAIFDNAAVADYETVGNAQISTSVKKYGTGSMYFDGTGDYLLTDPPSAQLMAFGTGDFTVEMWVYANTPQPSTRTALLSFGNGFTTNVWAIQLNNTSPSISNQINVWAYNLNSGAVWLQGGPTIVASTWYHIAVCRNGSTFKLFVNGTQAATATSTASIDGNSTTLQWQVAYNSPDYFNGYIDDIRITKGIARYNYNFTPPTAELPNIGGTVTLTADPYYDYTTLLLPGNGTNGAQNNTFLDSSTNAFSITRNGNTTQGTFSPFSQTGWSNYFDGSGDYLETPSNAAFTLGSSGDFTVECWVYATATPGNYAAFMTTWADANTGYPNRWFIGVHDSKIKWYNDAGASAIAASSNIQLNTWLHVAAVRSGSTITLYINGTAIGTQTTSQSYTTQGTVKLGYSGTGGNYFYGYISNARVVKGTAVYTANFTPPTAPLTAITNTSLLTCQSNRFIDNSTNAFAITRNGDVSVQAFSPFNPTAAWSAATNGGSGYFDGSGDYLTVADNTALDMGSSNFTIEGWYYPLGSASVSTAIFSKRANSGTVGGVLLYYGGTGLTPSLLVDIGGGWAINTASSVSFVANQWNHFAVVRNGSAFNLYINGVSGVSASNAGSIPDNASAFAIGAMGADGSGPISVCYMADFRIVKGTAVYTAAFTPPTAPLTAITNTSLLLNYTNAGIYDATSKNDLETVGNAQISTTQSKFGGSSMYFDGTGDYLAIPSGQNLAFGTGDFTVECWVRFDSTADFPNIFSTGTFNTSQFTLRLSNNTAKFQFYAGNAATVFVTGTTTVAINTWYHVAVARYSGTTKLYVNGVSEGTDSNAFTYLSSGTAAVGEQIGNADGMQGYIADLRITKGIARYTSNFTPPSTAFLTL